MPSLSPTLPGFSVEKSKPTVEEAHYWKRYFGIAMSELLKAQDPHVPGYFATPQGEMLLALSSMLPPGSTIVELGSLTGKSTRWLAVGAMLSGSRLYCVDPFKGLPEDQSHLWSMMSEDNTLNIWKTMLNQSLLHDPEIWGSINIVRKTTQEASARWGGPKIDFLFIDADHTRAVQDFEAFLPHLSDWAMVVQDDVGPYATQLYGLSGPNGLHEMLVREHWRIYGRALLDVAYTRIPEWWGAQAERIRDQVGGVAQWASWENSLRDRGSLPRHDTLGSGQVVDAAPLDGGADEDGDAPGVGEDCERGGRGC